MLCVAFHGYAFVLAARCVSLVFLWPARRFSPFPPWLDWPVAARFGAPRESVFCVVYEVCSGSPFHKKRPDDTARGTTDVPLLCLWPILGISVPLGGGSRLVGCPARMQSRFPEALGFDSGNLNSVRCSLFLGRTRTFSFDCVECSESFAACLRVLILALALHSRCSSLIHSWCYCLLLFLVLE